MLAATVGNLVTYSTTTTSTNLKTLRAKGMVVLLTFVVSPSGITFELKLGHNSFFHQHHSMHLKNESKLPLSYNDT